METRSRSFQNCTEAEIPGYNDCPSFLFQVNKAAAKTGRRNKIVTDVLDVSGNTKVSAIPPPPLTSRKSRRNLDLKVDAANNELLPMLTKEEILMKVEGLYSLKSKLSSQEFVFYKNKVDASLAKSLESDSVKQVFSMLFNDKNDKLEGQSLLREWLTSDTSISNWCPAFLKIYENTIENDI